jgi:hypothetical protein
MKQSLRPWLPRYERISEPAALERARLTGAPVNFVPDGETRIRRAYPSGKVIDMPYAVTARPRAQKG